MQIAMILVSGALALTPVTAWAQSTAAPSPDKAGRAETAKAPHGSGATVVGNGTENDRAIDAEQRRIDHMMSICNRC